MPEYRVAWLIDITADDPVEAAQIAFNIQRDRKSTATHFVVHDHENQWFVDLERHMQKPKQVLIKHHGFVIHNKPKESILIDPITQRTQVFTSQRAAKWSAAVYARIHGGFGHTLPSDQTADAMLRLMEKHK